MLFRSEDPSKYLGVFIDRSILNVNDIFEFANTVDIKHIKELLDMQINYNIAIAKEGLNGEYGVGILTAYGSVSICWIPHIYKT